jgi:hypothetical protein
MAAIAGRASFRPVRLIAHALAKTLGRAGVALSGPGDFAASEELKDVPEI